MLLFSSLYVRTKHENMFHAQKKSQISYAIDRGILLKRNFT